MKAFSIIIPGALALLLAASSALADGQNQRTIPFADPGAPGKVIIQVGLGDVHVIGADVTEVTVQSEEPLAGEEEPRGDGLRRLDSGPGTRAVSVSGNTITLGSGAPFGFHGGRGAASDLTVTVPMSTTVVVERSAPGDTRVEKLSGDVEIRAIVGDVVLQDLSGGAAVETVNGDIRAVFTALAAERPVSISAVRGDVDLHVPGTAKADVRFRTLRGEVLTDFGDELKTRMEDHWVEEGTSVVVDVETARQSADQDRRAAEKLARQAADDARRAEADARRAAKHAGGAHVSMPPMPPMPPMPHIPPMAGGRVVSGMLNEGGTDISVTTLNGSIRFRKAD